MDNYGWLIILILRLHFEGVVNYSTQPLNIDGALESSVAVGRGTDPHTDRESVQQRSFVPGRIRSGLLL